MGKLFHSPDDSNHPLERCDHCDRPTRAEDMGEDMVCMECVNREEEFRRDEMQESDVDLNWREW